MKQLLQNQRNKEYFSTRKRKFLLAFVLLIIIASLIWLTPVGKAIPLPFMPTQDQEEKARQETEELIKKVAKHIRLPDEDPVIATVQDKDLLSREQKFFEKAENGDMLLIYPKAAKAIIYSTKQDILVNVGPVTNGQDSAAESEVRP